jgi:hypothetical protein
VALDPYRSQVFIVDEDLRRQLEAETRGRIRSASDLAELSARESVELAKIGAARRVQQESLETERQQIARDWEKRALVAEAERAAIELDKPVQLARFANRLEVLRAELRPSSWSGSARRSARRRTSSARGPSTSCAATSCRSSRRRRSWSLRPGCSRAPGSPGTGAAPG